MTATLTPPEKATQKVILDHTSWETYQRLVAERGEEAQPRYSYDRGKLEIMVTSYEHESLKHDIATMVEILAEELDIDVAPAGSTTFSREDIAQAFEPDACFYIHGAATTIRGKRRIDLSVDPPPDLIIEVDIASPSLNKFPIFQTNELRKVKL
ncbi:MAG TPA: Uma2 family endonuclease [Blastocatellia bacterium]